MATFSVHTTNIILLHVSTVLLILILITAQEKSSSNNLGKVKINYNGSQILRIHNMSKEKMKYIHILEDTRILEILGGSIIAIEVLVLKDKERVAKQMLKDVNMEFGVVMDDVGKIINVTSSMKQVSNSSSWEVKTNDSIITWKDYHSLEDIYSFLEYLQQTFPKFVTVIEIGTTAEKRSLKVVKVSKGSNTSKSVWIDGGIHAREWISPASVTFILNKLVYQLSENSSTYSDVEFYFMPVMNPDGYEYSYTVDRFWRKNRAPQPNSECIGTDLNRNWGYKWGGKGSNQDPCSWNFAGSKPFSETETASVSNYINNITNLKGYVSYHSYGQYILFPWAHTYKRLPDYADLLRLGVHMAKEINKRGGAVYKVGTTADKLYTASGGSDDWARGIGKVKYSYTVELQDTGDFGFLLPPEKIIDAANNAYTVFKALSDLLMEK